MGILHVLKISLKLPSKRTVFQLNRVKTKDFLVYILFLHLLISFPNGVRLISNSIKSGEFGKESSFILFIYPLFIILFGIIGISLLASIGMIIRTINKRKLVYQLLWKMAVYALTYPIILYTFFDLLGITHRVINFLLLVIFLVIFFNMGLAYPKVRKKLVR